MSPRTAESCEKEAVEVLEGTTTIISPPPKLVIAEHNPAMLELLPAALESNIPGLEADVCWSRNAAVQKLSHADYDIFVANVELAERANFSLLRQHLELHPLIPFLVTARCQDHAIARHALDIGASDIIVTPLNPSEAVSAVRTAYRFFELRMTIALREKRLEFLLDKQSAQPANQLSTSFTDKNIMTLEEKFYSRKKTLQAYKRTIDALERSLAILSKQGTYLRSQISQAASMRLDALLDMARRGGTAY